mgnify:CR=1 FL=1
MTDFRKRAIRHGEIVLVPIAELPKNAVQKFVGDKYIVGHSETGHHHVLTAPKLEVYEVDDIAYLNVLKIGELEHQKTFEKHETKVINPGIYKIQGKRQFDYFQGMITKVRD